MRLILRLVGVTLLLLIILFVIVIFWPVKRTPATALPSDFKTSVEAGKYAMLTANCLACHTAEGGKAFAGGRPIESPFGTIWSTNITPDPETGIGRYSLADFRAALYDGLRQDEHHLYPAMPYENYRHLSEADIQNMYQYFMEEVEPVHHQVETTQLRFPFNQRWGLRLWNGMVLRQSAGFTPADNQDEQFIRGAYLVQAAAHCAACHSPRSSIMAQKGHNEHDAVFLSGGELGGWEAPSLRDAQSAPAQWSIEDMVAYLSSARNAHSSATGEMALVVRDSLQYLTPEDNTAIAVYLKNISAQPQANPAPTTTETETLLTQAKPDMPLGPRLYLDNCAGCHFVDGKGAPETFPELAGNRLVIADNPTGLLHVILHGATLPSTQTRPAQLRMPDFGWRLNDEEAAELATFVRQGWGNQAQAVTPQQVAKVRAQQP